MSRQRLLVANWKMNKTVAQARSFAEELGRQTSALPTGVELAVCPPFTALQTLRVILPSRVKLGAQNVHDEPNGAFTGEISAEMLAELGTEYVIVGHSERRQGFGEADDWVARKVRAVLAHGMKPIVCVGEDLEQRNNQATLSVVQSQTSAALAGLEETQLANCAVAYEPIWAIGSGQTPSPQDAQTVITAIRETVATLSGKAAQGMPILYGGSVKPDNIAGFVAQPDIDGALVGGASLKVDSFVALAKAMGE
ncbi:triose-phosphate isomerase [Alicyclobacillus tolerans]|uniref:triose-phosphate isomerase n=1 Tax=Alicyclobacillus tolerans TaxID=90970 RepID=UPI001EFFCC5F|nr:triose-phosphate isomerase [Alicyclobacillus tolerans]MCF8568189.1 triose-phosphate isomerase [Alicyclobacillus tolerans]